MRRERARAVRAHVQTSAETRLPLFSSSFLHLLCGAELNVSRLCPEERATIAGEI